MMIGPKNRLVWVRRQTESVTGSGDIVVSRVNVKQVWASIEPLRGQEAYNAKQVQAEVSHRIRIFYDSDLAAIGPKWDVLYATRAFDILSAIDISEASREFEIMATERL